jgi:hypothetical protein
MSHGITGYRNGCRCEECRAASRDTQRRYRAGLGPGATTPGLRVHGLNGYLRHKCRCEVCRAANTKHHRGWYARKKAAAQ